MSISWIRAALAAIIFIAVAGPLPALADCDIGGRAVPCATKSGHYRIAKPDSFGPHPTVVYLYGSTGNSGRILSNDGFVRAFVDRGYAVIVPAALDIRYADGEDSGWMLRNERMRKKRDDTKFIAEVLADAAIRHRIDRRRVLIAGMSRGGFLAWEIACHAPSLASAYAPVAGGYLGKMPKRCERPVRILHTHGRSDRVVPLDPERSWVSGGAQMRPLAESLEVMARTAGCTTRGPTQSFRGYDRTAWQNCPFGSSVDVMLHNGGHTIPLSWYSTVIDWFEGEGRNQRTLPPATGRFVRPGEGGSRFKRAKGASN